MPFPLIAALPAIGSAIGKIFGGASKSSQDQKNFDAQNAYNWERLKLEAPGQRARTSLGAALAKNYQPRSIKWGGPGSGLRGEIPEFSGGSQGAMRSALQDPMLQQLLSDAIAGKAPASYDQQATRKSSLLDKILGIGGLAGSLIGGVGGALKNTPRS